MKSLCAAILGVCVVVFAGTAKAQDDNAKKLVGVWIVEKSGSELPAGSSIEFTKDGKLNAVIKDAGGDMKFDGTYKLDKEKILVKITINNETVEETVTIKKLTDDTLEVEDKDKKVDVFKKKK